MVAVWMAVGARAGTITLASDGSIYSSLQAAIDAAPAGDTLTLSGAFDVGANLSKDLTLVGDGTASLADPSTWSLYVFTGSVTLDMLSFVSVYNGGSMVVRNSDITDLTTGGPSLVVEDSTVVGTEGIYASTGTATLSRVDFDHVATAFLHPLEIRGDAVVTCDRCTFLGTSPGAIGSTSTGLLTVTDSYFTDVVGGTVIFANPTPLEVTRTLIRGSDDYGVIAVGTGAFRNVGVWDASTLGMSLDGDGPWEITNCAFSGASTTLSVPQTGVTIRNTTFEDQFVNFFGMTPAPEYIAANTEISFGGTGTLAEVEVFVAPDGMPAPWSPLIDAGDPALFDLDGSRSDIGLFGGPYADGDFWADADGDGVGFPDDCDDGDSAVGRATLQHPDADGDGHPAVDAEPACPALGWAATGDDCDDTDPATWAPTTFYTDLDGDDYGADPIEACGQPDGAVPTPGDCNDHDGAVHDEHTGYVDGDGDGFGAGTPQTECAEPRQLVDVDGDCDDTNADVRPGIAELCDGVDQNCADGIEDELRFTQYLDADGDGFGDPTTAAQRCEPEAGWVSVGTDCDDTEDSMFPGGNETCDSLDNDCDGFADDGIDCNGACDGSSAGDAPSLWYADEDGDGAGDPATESLTACPPPGWVAVAGDCDDTDPSRGPTAPEIASDGVDQDCDGKDEGVYAGSCTCAGAPGRGIGWAPLLTALAVVRRRRRVR